MSKFLSAPPIAGTARGYYSEWYLRIEGELIADSILGRVASACRYLDIDGPNMRKWIAENRPRRE